MPDTLESTRADASAERASFSMRETSAAELSYMAEQQSLDNLKIEDQPTVGRVYQEVDAALQPPTPEFVVNPARLRALGNRLVLGYRAMHVSPEDRG